MKIFCFRARNVGCSLALAMRYIIVALVLKIYPWMLHSVGLSHLFMLHAVVLLIGVLFVFFVMPETRGLSLTELTTLFGGKLPNSETSSESTALTNTTSPQVWRNLFSEHWISNSHAIHFWVSFLVYVLKGYKGCILHI